MNYTMYNIKHQTDSFEFYDQNLFKNLINYDKKKIQKNF